MRIAPLLIVTAVAEAAAGLALLVVPAIVLAWVFGRHQPAPELLVIGRWAGAATLGLAIASWRARHDRRTPAQLGVLTGLLFFNVVVAVVFAYTGAVMGMAGVLLWPAVALHVLMAAWCLASPRVK